MKKISLTVLVVLVLVIGGLFIKPIAASADSSADSLNYTGVCGSSGACPDISAAMSISDVSGNTGTLNFSGNYTGGYNSNYTDCGYLQTYLDSGASDPTISGINNIIKNVTQTAATQSCDGSIQYRDEEGTFTGSISGLDFSSAHTTSVSIADGSGTSNYTLTYGCGSGTTWNGSTCTNNVNANKAGSITITSISPNPADTSVTISGTAVGGLTIVNPCGSAYYTQVTGGTANIPSVSGDPGFVGSINLTNTQTGDSPVTCPNDANGDEWDYSFSFSVDTSAFTAGVHTVTVSARDMATGTITNSASFTVTHPAVVVIPTLTTTTPTKNIAQTTATTGGTIVSNGGDTVATSGVVWVLLTDPTDPTEPEYIVGNTANQFTDGWKVGGPWVDNMGVAPSSLLLPGKDYRVRAYAVNSAGVGYGNDVLFTTLADTCPNGAINPGTCDKCPSGNVMNVDNQCVPVQVTVSATTPYNTAPSTNVNFAYTASTNSGNGTQCQLLDYNEIPITAYQSSSPIVYSSASVDGSYAYYVQCRDKLTTTATDVSNVITVNVSSPPTPPTSFTASCPIPGTIGILSWTLPIGFTKASLQIEDTTTGSPFINVIPGEYPNGTSPFSYTTSPLHAYDAKLYTEAPDGLTLSSPDETTFTCGGAYTAPQNITTADPTNITETTATSGGTIGSDGGSTVTTSGIVWDTTDPINEYKDGVGPIGTVPGQTTDGHYDTSPWSDPITGLTTSITYYVRAYAKNAIGISYGNLVSFTSAPATPVIGVCGDADGKTYPYPSGSYSPYAQCGEGTPSNNGAFPAPGGTANWQCQGLNRGTTSGICSASQDAPPISNFSASPSSITQGQTSKLSWTATASCSSADFNTSNQPSGTFTVKPSTTTTYTINCGGEVQSVTITVGAKTKPTYQEH